MSRPATRSSAPGKLILAGEHGVVHGHPGLVSAVDLRARVWLDPLPDEEESVVELELRDLDRFERTRWSAIRDYGGQVSERWFAWEESHESSDFVHVLGDDPGHVVKVALAEALAWLGESEMTGAVRLRVESRVPVASGFGSSAAVAVAVIGALLRHLGTSLPAGEIDALALEVERRQHGHPSGVDTATVLRGGLLWAERDADGSLDLSPVEPGANLGRFRVVDSGAPPEATGNVVSGVRHRLRRDPTLERELERMAAATAALRQALEPGGDGSPEAPLEPLRQCHAVLSRLGVVPAPVAERIARVEALGGAGKISGAGSLAGPGAGALLLYHPRPELLDELVGEPIVAGLGAEGLRWEGLES